MRDIDGLIDSDAADQSWASTRRGSRMGQQVNGEAAVHSATAKIAAGAAKLRLMSAKFEDVNARYADRKEAVTVARTEAAYTIAALRASPESAAAETFATSLGIDVDLARGILRRFIDAVLLEVGDLERQAVRDVDAA